MSLRAETPSPRLYPISPFQHFMVMIAQETEPTSLINQEKIIRWAVRISPALPPRALRRAFENLVARHDSLRLRFVKAGEEWRAQILDQHAEGLQVEDLSHLTKAEQDAVILERAKAPLTALSPALFEMRLLRCGAAGDVLLTRLNHAIGDGYSTAILVEDLLKFLFMTQMKTTAPGHADFIRIRGQGLKDRAEEKEQFWQNRLLPVPENLNIGLVAKGLKANSFRTVGKTRRLDDVLSDDLTNRIGLLSKASGVSSYCYLFAAFSETICDIAGGTQAVIKTAVSRHNSKLAEFIGAEVQTLVTKYTCDPDHLESRAAWVSEHISQGTAQLPTTAFNDGGVIDTCIQDANFSETRFFVHIEVPSGRLKGSPFSELFSKARNGKVTVGSVTLEQIPLPGDAETNFELMLLIDQTKSIPDVSLVANVAAYDAEDLQAIAQGIQRRLEHCCAQAGQS